eukprot:91825_1
MRFMTNSTPSSSESCLLLYAFLPKATVILHFIPLTALLNAIGVSMNCDSPLRTIFEALTAILIRMRSTELRGTECRTSGLQVVPSFPSFLPFLLGVECSGNKGSPLLVSSLNVPSS